MGTHCVSRLWTNMSPILFVALLSIFSPSLGSYAPAIIPPGNSRPEGRIVGGEDAAPGEFPYQVSLRNLNHLPSTHFCGGSVIAEDWVVTAAHCCAVFGIHVTAGNTHSGALNNEGEQHVNVEKHIQHEEYDAATISNDICLLKLRTSLTMTDYVQPIPLPEQLEETEAGTMCNVTGWGTKHEGGLFLPHWLQKVEVPVVDDTECRAAYGDQVLDSMICAGYPDGGKDSCQGDSGGPFVCDGKLTGVVSWGRGCARPGYPGVYTQVSYFANWIADTMAANP